MPNLLVADYSNTTPTVYTLGGTSLTQIGGVLHREVAQTFYSNNNYTSNGRAKAIGAKLFYWHDTRVYEFDGDAYYVPVGSYGTSQANFHAFSAGDTWSADGGSTTGTFLEDGVSTDGFIIVAFTTGSPNINNTDTITITSGTANTETADATADAAQGGDTNQEGEWKAVLTLSTTKKNDQSQSGLFTVPAGNELVLAGVFMSSSNNFHAVKYSQATETWTETGSLLATGSTYYTVLGMGQVLNGSLVVHFASTTAGQPFTDEIYGRFHHLFYDAGTDTITLQHHQQSLASSATRWGPMASHNNLVSWNGRIFFGSARNYSANSGGAWSLYELSGGSWTIVKEWLGGLGGGAFSVGWGTEHGGRLFVLKNSLYALAHFINQNGGNPEGWVLIRFHLEGSTVTNGTMDNPLFSGGSYPTDKFTDACLTASTIALDNTASPAHTFSSWIVDHDVSTSGLDSPRVVVYYIPDNTGSTTEAFTFVGEVDSTSGITYTWDGTTTVVAGSDPSGEVKVGSWIGKPGDTEKKLWRVTAVAGGSPWNITISNADPILTIPASGTGLHIINSVTSGLGFASVGSKTSIADFAFSNTYDSGGSRYFFKDGITCEILEVAPAAGKQSISVVVAGGGTGQVIRAYYSSVIGGTPDTQCSLSTTNEGSIISDTVGHKITGISADGGTKTFTWDFLTDGALEGESRRIIVRVTGS